MSLIKGYKPHDNQRLIHAVINQGKEKYFALNIGRQFGKTLLGINQLFIGQSMILDAKSLGLLQYISKAKKYSPNLRRPLQNPGYLISTNPIY